MDAQAARERGRKAGWMGSHRAAGLSDFAAERVCESLHMTDKIKFYYGVKLYNNTVFWRNNSFPVFLGSSYKADCGIKVVGFRGEFEGELLTFNEMREMEKNGLTDGSIVILVGCLDEALRLNNCKSNTEIIDGEVHYLHIIPRNAESRKLLKLYNNSPLELFGGSRNKIDIL